MKTKREVLQDVVDLIKKQGGRSLNTEGNCAYEGSDGKICGHSMAVKEKYREDCGGKNAENVIEEFTDEVHQEIYRGHSCQNWQDVQYFHDTPILWTHLNDLSKRGKEEMEQILLRHEYHMHKKIFLKT